MPRATSTTSKVPDTTCSIARSLGVLGERWTILILRDALLGSTRFAEFQRSLGIAPDVLADRLNTLVDHGVMIRVPYQEPSARSRFEYHLTPAGRELQIVLTALQQWGDAHLPHPGGPSLLRRRKGTKRAVHVGLVDDRGVEIGLEQLELVRTANYPTR